MTILLIPSEPLDEDTLNIQVSNLTVDFALALESVLTQAAANWSEATGMPVNTFMEDHLREVLLGSFIGFLTKTQPHAHQLTSDHVDAYFTVSAAPTPPGNNLPDPVKY